MYQDIFLTRIRPNPYNPRRRFVGKEFDELVESIAAHGVIEPIVVRPVPDAAKSCLDCEHKKRMANPKKGVKIPGGANGKCTREGGLCEIGLGMGADPDVTSESYELVAGERRWRASMAVADRNGGSEKFTIPAIIKDLDDDAAFDIMTIENLHRSDLTELEEARGFAQWAERKGTDRIPELAERCSVSPRYIRRRIAVLDLPEQILEAWGNGDLAYGHLEQFLRVKDDPETLDDLFTLAFDERYTVSEIKKDIDGLGCDLAEAIFDVSVCSGCKNNSETQMALFFDPKDSPCRCHDKTCFKQQVNNHLLARPEYFRENFFTNGFRFMDSEAARDRKNIPGKIDVACADCESLVSIVDYGGSVWIEKACIGPRSCFEHAYYAVQFGPETDGNGSADPEDPTGGDAYSSDRAREDAPPRVKWHGTFFREQFYQQTLPMLLADIPADDPRIDRLVLFSFIQRRRELHPWFAKRHAPDMEDIDRIWFSLGHEKLRDILSEIDDSDIKEEIKQAAICAVMDNNFGLLSRHVIAKTLAGIHIDRDWVMTAEYLGKKTKAELIDIGNSRLCGHDPIFLEDAAVNFLLNTLGVKNGRFDTLKKPDLIRVFTESGVDLTGRVPDEIVRADEWNPNGYIN